MKTHFLTRLSFSGCLFLLFWASASWNGALAQSARPWYEDFSGMMVSPADGSVPYAVTVEGGRLCVEYARLPESPDWASIDWDFAPQDASAHPYLSFEIRSDCSFLLAIRLYNDAGQNLWFESAVHAGKMWSSRSFEISSVEQRPFTRLQFFINPAVGRKESGRVEFRDFRIGPGARLDADFRGLEQALLDADELLVHLVEGDGPGQCEAGSRELLARSIQSVREASHDRGLGAAAVLELKRRIQADCGRAEQSVRRPAHGLSDPDATLPTIRLFEALSTIKGKHCLFGMQDMTTYGINADTSLWFNKGGEDRSDPKTVSGSHGALLGLDVFNIAENHIPELLQLARDHAQRGGALTLVWHQNNVNGGSCRDFTAVIPDMLPGGVKNEVFRHKLRRFADFALSLRDAQGRLVPILFRPYHEHNGDWFYWGKGRCSDEEYVSLWRYTVEVLRRDFGMHQLLVVFSPDGNQYERQEDYLWRYPGDAYVDVMGMDFYFGSGSQAEVQRLTECLGHAAYWASEKGKLAALAETGDRMGWDETECLEIPEWYTRCLLAALTADSGAREVVYAQVWRNGHRRHCFVPYPGHPALGDFLKFRSDERMIFLDEWRGIQASSPSLETGHR
jgi:mannan endo-1,4-beta-mannosidase